MQYREFTYNTGVWDTYFYEKNLQGDIVAIYDINGTKLATYTYYAYGVGSPNYKNGGASTGAAKNPFRYRGYYFDSELNLYYLNSRYYDPVIGRFISPDSFVSTGQGFTGQNMYVYCGNNPVMRIDPVGQDWYHWLIGAAIVVVCGAATVVTCGSFAAAASTVALVSSGIAATTVTATVSAGAFIGASVAYGSAVFLAVATSHTIDEFKDRGDWGTVVTTSLGGLSGAGYGYDIAKTQLPKPNKNPGRAFDPDGSSVQEGVDPNTLTPQKNLSTLSSQRMKSAIEYGGNQAIEVTRYGVILDGHHRVAYAIKYNRMVDVIVNPFK